MDVSIISNRLFIPLLTLCKLQRVECTPVMQIHELASELKQYYATNEVAQKAMEQIIRCRNLWYDNSVDEINWNDLKSAVDVVSSLMAEHNPGKPLTSLDIQGASMWTMWRCIMQTLDDIGTACLCNYLRDAFTERRYKPVAYTSYAKVQAVVDTAAKQVAVSNNPIIVAPKPVRMIRMYGAVRMITIYEEPCLKRASPSSILLKQALQAPEYVPSFYRKSSHNLPRKVNRENRA